MVKLRIFTALALGTLVSVPVSAEKSIVEHIIESGNITINQPEGLARLLVFQRPVEVAENEYDEDLRAANTRTGYRVQIFDDNNPHSARSQAEAAHTRISIEFPHLKSYMIFNSPYWRVKVGDFPTRAEAESVMAEIRQTLPNLAPYLRVVRDKINIQD